jgi:hypothetical protein
MPVLGAPALIYWPQHKGLRAVLATMIAEMRRFDAGLPRIKLQARIVFYSRSRRIFLQSRQIGLAGRGLLSMSSGLLLIAGRGNPEFNNFGPSNARLRSTLART